MGAPASERTRRLARRYGCLSSVLNATNLILATLFVATAICLGNVLCNSKGEKLFSNGVDPAPILEHLTQRSDLDYAFSLMEYSVFSVGLVAISAPQYYGASLLSQATRLNENPSEAILKVNTQIAIQMGYMFIEFPGLVYLLLTTPEGIVDWTVIFYIFLFLFRFVGFVIVFRFWGELHTAADTDCEKNSEEEKESKDKTVEAETLTISIPEEENKP
ncbi:unnamed protein product [Orchesella dallaii]|uniref:Uncharacterized protein n=1 Tax=Orchesella dallaii TaxID=48710 RepID=A0ABP1S8U5_9HEXA